MKKILIAGAIAIASIAALTACSGSASEDKNLGDSLSTSFGTMNGYQINSQFEMIPTEERAKYDKDQIIAGIKHILAVDTANQGYLAGLQIGLGMYGNILSIESDNVKVDRKKLINALEAALKADSVSQGDMLEAQARWNTLYTKAMGIAQEEADAARASSPEAKKNAEEGKKFIEKQKAADPEIKTTASGLCYKITAPGNGDATPGDNDIADVIYTGRLVDGTQFDSSNGETVQFPVNRVIPGFTEALKMMKKGQKMTIYIPGDLAYGVNGTPDGKIGPNATLVFDIELVDFNSME